MGDLSPKKDDQNYSGYRSFPAQKPGKAPNGGAPVVTGSKQKSAGNTHKVDTRKAHTTDGKPGGATVGQSGGKRG